MLSKKIKYSGLNSRQKENFNFQKISAILADYGFNCLRLTDDWEGADFIACHIDGENFLKIQLKGRLTFDKKYVGKNIHICFRYNNTWYLYPHDELLNSFFKNNKYKKTSSWENQGTYSFRSLSLETQKILQSFAI